MGSSQGKDKYEVISGCGYEGFTVVWIVKVDRALIGLQLNSEENG